MKHLLAPILLLTLLFPSLAYGVTLADLVVRDGLHYKQFSDVPFTGKITGRMQTTFKNGKKDGPLFHYWHNGQLWNKGTYKDGQEDGPWVTYYIDGQVEKKGTYKDGRREGPWVSYDKDGTVNGEYTGTFEDGKKVK